MMILHYMSIQILKTPPETSHFNAHHHLSAVQQDEHENQMPQMQSLVPFFRGWYKPCLSCIKGAIFGRYATAQFGTTAQLHIQRFAK